MSKYKARLSENGRILLPAKLRQEMHLHPGDELILQLQNDTVQLTTLAHAVKRAQLKVKKHTKGNKSLADQLIAMRRKEAKDE